MKHTIFLISLVFLISTSNASAQDLGVCSLDNFTSSQDNSQLLNRTTKNPSLPEDEFLLNYSKKHLDIINTCEYKGVAVDFRATKYQASLSQLDDGKYKLSFKICYYDFKGNILDMISESYYDGVVVKEEDDFVAHYRRTFSFKDGEVLAKIERRGYCQLIIDFKKPLYSVLSKIEFRMKTSL